MKTETKKDRTERATCRLCYACKWWFFNADTPQKNDIGVSANILEERREHVKPKESECRINAPIGDNKWPVTRHSEWCGQYKEDARLAHWNDVG